MTTVILKQRHQEVEKRIGINPIQTKKRIQILRQQSNAKTFKSYIESSIKLTKESYKKIPNTKIFSPEDFIQLLEEVKLKYLEYNKPIEQELKKEYGKSGFEYKIFPEIIEIKTYRKGKPFIKPLVRKESEWILNTLENFKEKRPTWSSITLGLLMADVFGYEVKTIKDYYSDRFYQNYWTTHLRYLREIGQIEYSGGNVSLVVSEHN